MSFFTEVIRPSADYTSMRVVSDLHLLFPPFRRKVLACVLDAKAHGLKLSPYETYRSQQRQEALFEQGATQLRTVGVHHYGLACDLVYWIGAQWEELPPDICDPVLPGAGRWTHGEPSWKGTFDLLGHVAAAHGLVWGGNWGHPHRPTGFPDLDHVQFIAVADQGPLFRGEWYPGAGYIPTPAR